MTKKQIADLGISEDLAEKALKVFEAELADKYVEKHKYELAVTEKETLQVQIKEHGKQLEDLKKSVKGSEELEAKIKELQSANDGAKTKYGQQINELHINYAIENALKECKAKNATAVRSLLDMKEISLDDNGKVKGLDKQLKKLQEADDSKFLFDLPPDPKDGKPPVGSNANDNDGNAGGQGGDGSKSIGQLMAEAYNAEHAVAADK